MSVIYSLKNAFPCLTLDSSSFFNRLTEEDWEAVLGSAGTTGLIVHLVKETEIVFVFMFYFIHRTVCILDKDFR